MGGKHVKLGTLGKGDVLFPMVEVIDAGMEDFARNVGDGGGGRINPKQLEIFRLWAIGMKHREIEERLGLSKFYMNDVRRTAWFEYLRERWMVAADRELGRSIIAHDEKIGEAWGEILEGKRSDDKSVMGQTRLIETRLQLGANPLMNKRGTINIQQNNMGGSGTINLGALKGMTQEELLEMRESGVIPPRMTEGNG